MRKKLKSLVKEMLDGQLLLNEAKEEFEKVFIEEALKRNKNNISKTAEMLGMHRNTISKRLASYEKQEKGQKPIKRLVSRKSA